MITINSDNYKEPITEEQKEQIRSLPEFSEEMFYRYKFGWELIFPLLTEEEVETLAWKSFMY